MRVGGEMLLLKFNEDRRELKPERSVMFVFGDCVCVSRGLREVLKDDIERRVERRVERLVKRRVERLVKRHVCVR